MKPYLLSTATILLISLMGAAPTLAQSQTITCLRDRNVIDCSDYGSFRYRSNNNNNGNVETITCFRDRNVIDCQGYGSFKYRSNNSNNNGDFNRPGNNSRLEGEINNIYLQVLGRNADSSGLRTYTQAINNQGWTLDQVRRDLASSPEFDRAINRLYQEFFGRNADAAGLQKYRNLVINGGSLDDVRNEIADSPEVRNRNNNNGDFNRPGSNSRLEGEINDIYLQVLGRNADSSSLRTYTQAINNRGWTLDQVRHNLVSSPEFNQAINSLYQEFLGRNADAAGLQKYRDLVINGGSLDDVRNDIYNSPKARKTNDNIFDFLQEMLDIFRD
jgi:uncharacterized protein YbcI